MFLEINK